MASYAHVTPVLEHFEINVRRTAIVDAIYLGILLILFLTSIGLIEAVNRMGNGS